jgi:mannosyltransferase OCH1-like enzyme
MIQTNRLIAYLTLAFIFALLITFNITYNRKRSEVTKLPEYVDTQYNIKNANVLHDKSLTKKIWQTAPPDARESIHKLMETWKDVRDWDYINEKDADVINYLKKTFPELKWDRIMEEKKILAFDLWRYSKIYDEGGLYADSDVFKAREFETSMTKLGGCKVIVGVEADARDLGDWWVGKMQRPLQFIQWSFYSAPKHPMFKFVIERVVQKLKYRLERDDDITTKEVEELTGPAVWSDSIKEYIQLAVGVNLEKDMTCGQSYMYKDVCILNIMAMGLNTVSDHSCKNIPEQDNFIINIHKFDGSWKDDFTGGKF